VVGPALQAEGVQKEFHDFIGADEPLGWDTQLPNEPVINVSLTTAHLLAKGRLGESAEWRIVPVGSLGLGTYFTDAGLGMYGEAGWNIVDALGGTALREGLNAASTAGVGPVDGWSVAFLIIQVFPHREFGASVVAARRLCEGKVAVRSQTSAAVG
jgi:hypothetical protein